MHTVSKNTVNIVSNHTKYGAFEESTDQHVISIYSFNLQAGAFHRCFSVEFSLVSYELLFNMKIVFMCEWLSTNVIEFDIS